jgi:hypothetical protein
VIKREQKENKQQLVVVYKRVRDFDIYIYIFYSTEKSKLSMKRKMQLSSYFSNHPYKIYIASW